MFEIKPKLRLLAIEIFKYKGRICAVMKLDNFDMPPYCTGYVEVFKHNYGKNYSEFIEKIETEELTYSGNLSGLFDGVWFFGFDSAHTWNFEHPETQTFEYVKDRTKKLCEEMVKKRI